MLASIISSSLSRMIAGNLAVRNACIPAFWPASIQEVWQAGSLSCLLS
jgi:hypothetical protein